MIMDARIAAELLYESEATLRMVDTVLDELHAGELEAEAPMGPRLVARNDYPESGSVHAPNEFCVRGYWQVQDLLETVQQARQMIAPGEQTEFELTSSASDPRLDLILSLVDSLETLDETNAGERTAMLNSLRDELRSMVGTPANAAGDQSSAAKGLLAEAEAKLTRLGYMFEDGDAAA